MHYHFSLFFTARKRSLGQGNAFTTVCLFTWGGGLPNPPMQTPMDADPSDADTPGMKTPQDVVPSGMQTPGMQNPPRPHPRSGQLAGGTHPTGMHTCVVRNHVSTPCLLFTLIIFNFQLFLLVMFYGSAAMHLVHLLNPMLCSNIIRILEI